MLVKVNLELKVTEDDMECIIDMAGYGIAGWCSKAAAKESGYDVYEDDESKWHRLGYDDILKGIQLYIENGNQPYNIMFIDDETGESCIDSGQVDAEVADSIIQYACFGEIIYG